MENNSHTQTTELGMEANNNSPTNNSTSQQNSVNTNYTNASSSPPPQQINSQLTRTLIHIQRLLSNQILLHEGEHHRGNVNGENDNSMELSIQIDSNERTQPHDATPEQGSNDTQNTPPNNSNGEEVRDVHTSNVEDPFSGTRVDLHQFAKYLEQVAPFLLLLVLLFLYEHHTGILFFLWHSSVFLQVNQALRRQVVLREKRSVHFLVGISVLLLVHIFGVYYLFQDDEMWRQLLLLPPNPSIPLTIWGAFWIVVMNDLVVRFFTMVCKAVVICYWGGSAYPPFKRKAQFYTVMETLSATYRNILPISVWFRYFYAVDSHGHIFSCLLAGLYLTFKLSFLYDRLRHCSATLKAFILREVQYGKYATTEQMVGADVCPICQDRMTDLREPIVLECGHMFCEECVSQWFEREKTCPLCRTQIPTAGNRSHSDGTTSLLVQLF